MRELEMDGNGWQTRDDVYDSFFAAVGAPQWHGRNLNAMNDSIANGQINAVEVPYRIVIRNFELIRPAALQMTRDFANLIRELAARGCPVQIEVRNSRGAIVNPEDSIAAG